ncbi:MAG: cupin domain-containing protein [Burkholderiales bacterium]
MQELKPIRRVIAAIKENGKSAIVEDGPPPANRPSMRPGFSSRNIWATFGTPAPLNAIDRGSEVKGTMPPLGGTVFKYLDIPPDNIDAKRVIDAGKIESSEPGLRRVPGHPLHPGMHETDSIDYAIVLSGEIYAVMEENETLLKAGDVLIQCATMHAWSNRSNDVCRILFVLVDGRKPA